MTDTKKEYFLEFERTVKIPTKVLGFIPSYSLELEKRVIEVTEEKYHLFKDLDYQKYKEWAISGKVKYPEVEAIIDEMLEDN